MAESFGENGEKDERKVRENGEERERYVVVVTNERLGFYLMK